jgi:hypothetical protein
LLEFYDDNQRLNTADSEIDKAINDNDVYSQTKPYLNDEGDDKQRETKKSNKNTIRNESIEKSAVNSSVKRAKDILAVNSDGVNDKKSTVFNRIKDLFKKGKKNE